MSLAIGIVGLPNVGKSSLLNILTKAQAEIGNFPFTTIEPNVGVVIVPDLRLEKIAAIYKSQKTVPTTIRFVDIAGLIKGASKGAGLGNQFLGHIRNVDAVVEVVRCFKESNVLHVDDGVDPIRDIKTIETELLLSDIEHATRLEINLKSRALRQDKEAIAQLSALSAAIDSLNNDRPLRLLPETTRQFLRQFNFLTLKPKIFLANTDETTELETIDQIKTIAKKTESEVITISLKSEDNNQESVTQENSSSSWAHLPSGVTDLISASYQLVGLITFFTAGPKESRAWTILKGAQAQEAAGVIHSDFARGFIRAHVISYQDLIKYGSERSAKEAGRRRSEGKSYTVVDGDIIEFLFNV